MNFAYPFSRYPSVINSKINPYEFIKWNFINSECSAIISFKIFARELNGFLNNFKGRIRKLFLKDRRKMILDESLNKFLEILKEGIEVLKAFRIPSVSSFLPSFSFHDRKK